MNYLSPEDVTFFLINRASLSVNTIFKKILAKNKLTEIKPSYLGALMCLWASEGMDEVLSKFGSKDGMRLSELGRCAGLEPSTITGLLDRMERDGLVYRANVPNDRRAQKATLTEKGSLIRNSVLKVVNAMEKEAFAGIDSKDVEVTKKVLRVLLKNAGKRSD